MRYELTDGQPSLITKVTVDGMLYTNPSDSFLDENEIGYTRTIIPSPEVSDETKKLIHTYEVIDGSITDVWTEVEKTNEELINLYIEQITDIYNTSENYKHDGKILYPGTGKEYIPRWVFEFYNTALINKDNYFPTAESTIDVAAVDGTSDKMTFQEFVQFYYYLISQYMSYTNTQNEDIAELTAKIKELSDESVLAVQ